MAKDIGFRYLKTLFKGTVTQVIIGRISGVPGLKLIEIGLWHKAGGLRTSEEAVAIIDQEFASGQQIGVGQEFASDQQMGGGQEFASNQQMGGVQEFASDQQMGGVQEFASGQQIGVGQEFASDQQMGGGQEFASNQQMGGVQEFASDQQMGGVQEFASGQQMGGDQEFASCQHKENLHHSHAGSLVVGSVSVSAYELTGLWTIQLLSPGSPGNIRVIVSFALQKLLSFM
ncbi:hypothetical protein STEG23_026168 [Scotinomys teguina]